MSELGSDALELRAGLPGWTLRALVAVAAGGIVAVLVSYGIGGAALALLCLAAAMSVVAPASPSPALVILLVAISVIVVGDDPFTADVLLMIPLVHLLHVSCGIAGLLPASARVHLSALKAPAIRFVAIQAGVFAMAGLLAIAPGGQPPAAVEIGAILGVGVIALLIGWLTQRPS